MEHDLKAYRKQCAGICAAVPKNSTNLKLFRCSGPDQTQFFEIYL